MTISEIYEANDRVRSKLKGLVSDLSDEIAESRENGEGWSIKEIVEHLAMVEEGMTKICSRMLAAGAEKGDVANGEAKLSDEFLEKTTAVRGKRVEAPERVHPTGTKSLAESLGALDANRLRLNDLRPMFETVECSEFKFPHPAFGDLSAHEWLLLVGGHESRHTAQIGRILAAG